VWQSASADTAFSRPPPKDTAALENEQRDPIVEQHLLPTITPVNH
jgi:hypothetical protein